MTERADATRIACAERRLGSIQPATRAEMMRDVYLTSGAAIEGGVWANRLVMEGPDIRVRDAVFARGAISIRAATAVDDDQVSVDFGSTVVTADSIVVNEGSGRIRVRSNIFSRIANLRNCIVYGNVYARRVSLRNCIVVGGVFAKDDAEITDSIVGTFSAARVQLAGHTQLLMPSGMAIESLDIERDVQCLLFDELDGTAPDESANLLLSQSDVHRVDASGRATDQGDRLMLSAAKRILDVERLSEILVRGRQLCSRLALDAHLPNAERASEEALADLEQRLLATMPVTVSASRSSARTLEDLLNEGQTVGLADAFRSLESLRQASQARQGDQAGSVADNSTMPDALEALFATAR